MININIYKLFYSSLKWNTIEAVVYQTILTIHHILLFSAVAKLDYALIGTIFSLLYLTIVFLNFGLDKSLATFFVDYSKTKSNFKKFFISQILIQLFFLSLIGLIVIPFKNSIGILFSTNFKCPILENSIWIILAILLVSESLKKTLRTFAQLAFLNKQTTIIETCTITLYFIFIWTYYLYTSKIDIFIILIPFILESLASNIFLSIIIYKFYKNITENLNYVPTDLSSSHNPSIKNIVFNRLYVYINQLTHLFFSGNFIIPFLAYKYGLEQISSLKLTNNIAVFITVLMERIFGITSAALLTHVKNLKISKRREAIQISTDKLYNILYAIIIFLIINFKFITSYKMAIANINWMPIYLFLILIFFENFFITYEQYLIVEEKSYYLMLINSISAILFYIISIPTFEYNQINKLNLSLSKLLTILIFIRVFSFILLRLVCYLKLKMNLPYKIKPQYLLCYILFSIAFFILTKIIFKNP